MFGMMNGGKGGGNQLMQQGGGMGQNPGLASLFAGNKAVNQPGPMMQGGGSQLAPITAPVRPNIGLPPRIPLPQAQAPVAAAPRPWQPGMPRPHPTSPDFQKYHRWWATNRAGSR